jgi:hypothetical protein
MHHHTTRLVTNMQNDRCAQQTALSIKIWLSLPLMSPAFIQVQEAEAWLQPLDHTYEPPLI